MRAAAGDTPAIVQAPLARSSPQRGDTLAADVDVLDVPQVASLLGVGRNTIYALVAKNEIPHRRLGKAIRFGRSAVMSWLGSWSSRDAKEGQ
jgi:excisionase family DNA binding protein